MENYPATIKVYHDPETNFHEAPNREAALQALERSRVVAKVKGRNLERAFMLTNHIDRPWWENEDVEAAGTNGPPRFRSTSVGDFMVVQDAENDAEVVYQVATFGFNEIDRIKFFGKAR